MLLCVLSGVCDDTEDTVDWVEKYQATLGQARTTQTDMSDPQC
jgi:hypothetical protein